MAKRTEVPEGKQRVRVAEGIYKKRSGKYLVTYRDPGHRQRWKEFGSKQDAVLFRAKAVAGPRLVISSKTTLGEAWETFLRQHGAGLAPSTRKAWEQQWTKHIEPEMGTWPLKAITIRSAKDYLAELERRGVGPATRQKIRTILLRVCGEAVENDDMAENPFEARGTRVKLPQPKKARALTVDEYRAVRGCAYEHGSSDGLAIELMFLLGLRIGEMAGLQVGDIDFDRREITITRTVSDVGGELIVQDATKSRKYRTLPIPELPIWGKLEAHVKASARIGEAHLFTTSTGTVIRPNNWRRRVWAKVMVSAGIENPPTPHAARRTTASLLSGARVPQATIQRILGHATLAKTGEYIQVAPEAVEEGFRELASVLEST